MYARFNVVAWTGALGVAVVENGEGGGEDVDHDRETARLRTRRSRERARFRAGTERLRRSCRPDVQTLGSFRTCL